MENSSSARSDNASLRKCKLKARKAPKSDPTINSMWKKRGARVSLIIASQLCEMKDFGASTKPLESLCNQSEPTSALRSALARIYLQGRYIQKAKTHFSFVEQSPDATEGMKRMNRALLACANGEWDFASTRLTHLIESEPDNFVVSIRLNKSKPDVVFKDNWWITSRNILHNNSMRSTC
ncbi:hypothetical protein HHX47_DHR1001199 [Lentinula edodes]|nr:hypothetical protein HHX47_DHR1001199 [Lentinula edodes]